MNRAFLRSKMGHASVSVTITWRLTLSNTNAKSPAAQAFVISVKVTATGACTLQSLAREELSRGHGAAEEHGGRMKD